MELQLTCVRGQPRDSTLKVARVPATVRFSRAGVAGAYLYPGHVGHFGKYCIVFNGKQLYGPRHVSDILVASVAFCNAIPPEHSTISSRDGKNQIQRSPPFGSYLDWVFVVSANLVFKACRQDGQPVVNSAQVKTEQFCSFLKRRQIVGVSKMVDFDVAIVDPERRVRDKLDEWAVGGVTACWCVGVGFVEQSNLRVVVLVDVAAKLCPAVACRVGGAC